MATWTNYDLEQPSQAPQQSTYNAESFYKGQSSPVQKYVESDNVTKAKAYLDSQLNASAPSYNNRYQGQISDLYNALKKETVSDVAGIQNAFNRDYRQNVTRAADETTALLQNLAGGYRDDQAKKVASQMYNQAMLNQNDTLPGALNLGAQMASDRRSDLYNQLTALMNQEETEYGRYRDTVKDRQNEILRAQNMYLSQAASDRDAYATDRNFSQSVYQNEVENAYKAFQDYQGRKQNQINTDNEMNQRAWQQQWSNYYNSLKASEADKQAAWTEDYNRAKLWIDEQQEAAAAAAAAAKASSNSSSSSSSGSRSGSDSDATVYDYSKIANDGVVRTIINAARQGTTMMSQAEFNRRKGNKSAYNGYSSYEEYLDDKLTKYIGSNGKGLTEPQISYIFDALT